MHRATIANQGYINRLGYGNIVTYREVQMTISIKVLIGDPMFTTFVYGKCNGCDKKRFPCQVYDNTFLLKWVHAIETNILSLLLLVNGIRKISNPIMYSSVVLNF